MVQYSRVNYALGTRSEKAPIALTSELGEFIYRGTRRIRREAEAWLCDLKLEGRYIFNKSTLVMVRSVADVGYIGRAAPPNIDGDLGAHRRKRACRRRSATVLDAVPVVYPVEDCNMP